ncbi:MAG: hypothetical protein ABR572_11975, partial [Cryomorphaceae bacterium]
MVFVGKQIEMSGFVTLQRFVQGRTLSEIENILGFRKGKFAKGVMVSAALELPEIDGFELAGYSQVAGHRTEEEYGNINSPADQSEADAYAKEKQLAMATWSLYGTSRLIKFSADIGHMSQPNAAITRTLNDYQYPPGRGVPQWNILREKAVPFKVIARLEGYPDERF